MRKLRYALPVALILGTATAVAQNPSGPITTAQGAANAQGTQKVELRGRIAGQRGANYFVLFDRSGSVEVEISEAVRKGQKLAAGTEVEIRGEVDGTTGNPPKVMVTAVNVVGAR